MRITTDLHIHSPYSRATSSRLSAPYLDRWAGIKGIGLVGTGDCTHPRWLSELRENLDDAEPGLFTLKNSLRSAFNSGAALSEEIPQPRRGADAAVRFVLSGEISTIYGRDGKTRKVHHLVLLPNFKAAALFNTKLEKIGNIRSDGRPILGIDARDLFSLLLETDERSMLIPAHIWTPWFSALGAKSGFDSIEECYGDLASFIPAIETGLSSDPPMNWALSSLDRYSIISNSDAHSPDKLGREATILDMELSYDGLRSALFPGSDTSGIIATVEFFPEEGKYHYDGHRKCGVCRTPADAGYSGAGELTCPVCGKNLTRGVMGRVMELADRPIGGAEQIPAMQGKRPPYYSLIPLKEILGELLGTGTASKKVQAAYFSLIENTESELSILMDMSIDNIKKINGRGVSPELLAEAINRMRLRQVFITAGYDGEYGIIRVFPPGVKSESGWELFYTDSMVTPPDSSVNEGYRQKENIYPAGFVEFTAGQNGAHPELFAHNGMEQKPAKKIPVSIGNTEKKHQPQVQPAHSPDFNFDSAQKAIITHEGKRALIIAGPGTGKTAVLAARIAKLIDKGVRPSSILALSFTVKAAGELRQRINSLITKSPKSRTQDDTAGEEVHTATFHSFCCSVLRQQAQAAGISAHFEIINETQRRDIITQICKCAEKKISVGTLGRYIEERKRYLLLPGEEKPRSLSPAFTKVLTHTGANAAFPDLLAGIPPIPAAIHELEELYSQYRITLNKSSLLDYDDLVSGTARLLASRQEIRTQYCKYFSHIFIDEYQDINLSQYILLRLLADNGELTEKVRPSLWVIGDPNQAIYGFRGSDKRFIDRFLVDFPDAERFELARSFRCAQPIINAAAHLAGTRLSGTIKPVDLCRREYPSDKSEAEGIARSISRLIGGTSFFARDSVIKSPDKYTAGNSTGQNSIRAGKDSAAAERNNTYADYEDTAAPGDCAILLRATPLAEPIIKALTDHGIPYNFCGEQAWWEEEPFKSFLNTVKTSSVPEEEFQKGQNNTKLTRLFELAEMTGGISPLLDAFSFSESGGIPEKTSEGVHIMTIHAAKGLEFDHVFVPACEDGILPFTLYGEEDPDLRDEERRLLYVAMTRARIGLVLSWAHRRNFKGRLIQAQASPFLNQLEKIIPLIEEKRPFKKTEPPSLF